jgi:RNase P subunit RPR2
MTAAKKTKGSEETVRLCTNCLQVFEIERFPIIHGSIYRRSVCRKCLSWLNRYAKIKHRAKENEVKALEDEERERKAHLVIDRLINEVWR